MIKYINKIPSKIEYYDMVRTIYEENEIDVPELTKELERTISAVCAYKGERLVGIGRIKKEGNHLCIEDLIVKLELCKEEIQKNIIVNLFKNINQMRYYDITVRDCLDSQNTDKYYNNENVV